MLQGFASTMDAIIENLPTTRQTMLFSATQTKRVSKMVILMTQAIPQVGRCMSVHEAAPPACMIQSPNLVRIATVQHQSIKL